MDRKIKRILRNMVIEDFKGLKRFQSQSEGTYGNLNRYGFAPFVSAVLDEGNAVNKRFLAELIASYDPKKQIAEIRGRVLYVNKDALASALNLPDHMPAAHGRYGLGHTRATMAITTFDYANFLDSFVFGFMCLCPGPNEVVQKLYEMKVHPERFDFAGFMWLLVEDEILKCPAIKRCYYGRHLQCLIRSQHPDLFVNLCGAKTEDDDDVVEEDEDEDDSMDTEEVYLFSEAFSDEDDSMDTEVVYESSEAFTDDDDDDVSDVEDEKTKQTESQISSICRPDEAAQITTAMDLRDNYFQPTDEILIEYLIQLNNGEALKPDRFERRDLFFSHPSIIIDFYNDVSRSYPSLIDDAGDGYYLFYCKVPDGTSCDGKGYHRIRDRSGMGVWENMGCESSECDISGMRVFGQVQELRYTLLDGTATDWMMVLYFLRDDESKMVICKVVETEEAVRSAADAERDSAVLESAHDARIELLRTFFQEEDVTRFKAARVIEMVKKVLYAEKMRERKRVERKEAQCIEASPKRAKAERSQELL